MHDMSNLERDAVIVTKYLRTPGNKSAELDNILIKA